MQTVQKVEARSPIINLSIKASLAVGSVLIALTAIFPLSEWAETAAWHHALQHVLIFSGGLGFGAVLFTRRNAKESK